LAADGEALPLNNTAGSIERRAMRRFGTFVVATVVLGAVLVSSAAAADIVDTKYVVIYEQPFAVEVPLENPCTGESTGAFGTIRVFDFQKDDNPTGLNIDHDMLVVMLTTTDGGTWTSSSNRLSFSDDADPTTSLNTSVQFTRMTGSGQTWMLKGFLRFIVSSTGFEVLVGVGDSRCVGPIA
jgi:hypothetical protein